MNETISMLKLTLIAAVSVVLAYFNALWVNTDIAETAVRRILEGDA